MDHEIEVDERHPFRFLVKLLLLVGVVFAAGRFVAVKKKQFAGLTESQAKDKLVEKISPKVGDDKAQEIADQVIPKLKEKGLLKADADADVMDAAEAAVEETADTDD